ncbi:MAG TPA: hypothetical protein VMJ12_14765 [Candidatus Acidoferrales bacterium]|nr:hypothetical protein [Candidatus Acidoferrales bacterium]
MFECFPFRPLSLVTCYLSHGLDLLRSDEVSTSPERFRGCTTVVPKKSKTPLDISRRLRNGHSQLTRNPDRE